MNHDRAAIMRKAHRTFRYMRGLSFDDRDFARCRRFRWRQVKTGIDGYAEGGVNHLPGKALCCLPTFWERDNAATDRVRIFPGARAALRRGSLSASSRDGNAHQ